MDAASEVVTVPVSDVTVTATQKSTDTFNVNQSNNNTHTQVNVHTGSSNSLLSKIASNVIGGSSLNIAGSSNSNSSCSSSSTSSNSSGYGSSTTTPTNNYDLQNTTPTTTPIPATTNANTEHIIPVATVAAVTPFFNESITTHNLDTQHNHHHLHHHHAQQTQEQLQQQQQQHHMLQTHHQQYNQNHLPANLPHQQHHQYLSRQQYYAPYDYQQTAPPHNLTGASVTPTVAPYSMIIPGPYEMSATNVGQAFGSSQYKSSIVGSNFERSPIAKTNVPGCTQQQTSQQLNEQQQSKALNHHFSALLGTSKPSRSSSSFMSNSISTNTSKPQATATPFYANPLPFYDNYKHKIPLEYPDTYSNTLPAPTATYHQQQQKYYAAAKSQLKETSYGSPTVLSSKSAYANASNVFPGSTGGLNLSSGSYDKYMYPHAAASGYTATGHLGNETPPEVSNYRKPVVGNNMNSPSWPWGIEYASGNSRSIPPPASHIPTATVAPTHATHLTQNPAAVLARDSFYVAHDKYAGKYDKYTTPSYPQTYVSPPTNRHMWSNTTPHVSNLTQFNDRHLLASGPPALAAHGPHTAPYFSSNHNTSLNSRQACCSQPYQSQGCYYPVSHPVQPRMSHNQSSTVAAPPSAACLPGQQALGQSPHLNALTASCKYGGVFSDYGNPNKMKTSNDLYLNSHHYDISPPLHNFGYPTAHNSQPLYNTNAHQTMAHAATPTSLLTNDPFNANPTSYTNDLNLTTSNFDNYHTHADNHPSQSTLNAIHNTHPAPPPAYGPTVAKRALLDYRKPIQPQPPPTITEDCYTSLTSRDHYNQHELLNTPETTTTFEEYEVHPSNINEQRSTEVLNDAIGVADESNKNLSLRDFIANWNDDEDEYQNNEELNFDQTAVINEVLQTASIEQETTGEVLTIQEVKIIKSAALQVKDNEIPKEDDVKIAEDSSAALNEKKVSPYVNLPDIVIDVKKSNNINNSITTPTISPIPIEVIANTLNLTDFDVEKELDELNLKKPVQQEELKEINDIKNSKNGNTPQLSPGKSINHQLCFEDFSLEPTSKTVLNAITTRLAVNQAGELNEQYLKDIEGYESSCSRHSNESAFEKEYETFINKITNESSSGSRKKGEQKSIEAEKEIEFEQNVQDFSKFYKRKRKLQEDELKSSLTANQSQKKIKTNNSNFPQVYTKKSRNRLIRIKTKRRNYRHKPLSTFYKIIYFIRHQTKQRKKRVREFILDLKDKHLPLIKRQSIKNYTPDVNENMSVPKTLKALCIRVFNTEEFRQILFLTKDPQPNDVTLETEEKHICTDPTCETCEVIKSLMETENFETSLLQQTTEPTLVYCAAVTQEPISHDLNFRNEETLITNTIEDNLYVPENFALEEDNYNFQLELEPNIGTKVPAEMVLPAAYDNFDTAFSPTDKEVAETQCVESPIHDSNEFVKQDLIHSKTNTVREKINETENLIQPVAETSFYENLELQTFANRTSLYCDLSAEAETLTEVNSGIPEESTSSKTSRTDKPLNENVSTGTKILSPPKSEKYCKTAHHEQTSDSEDSTSSDSESESSSSSDTEDKSDPKESSSSESSDTDIENDFEEQISNQQSKQKEVTQLLSSSENKLEENSCSPHMQSKLTLDNEKVPNSPQRIVIRITKSLSLNEQSLRVENISAKPLKTQYLDDDPEDNDNDPDTKKDKTDLLVLQQEDIVSKPTFEEQSDSDNSEECKIEKKLVTPLKLVLRGKEYLTVKTVKKSLNLQTARGNNTESEPENEEFVKESTSKIIKLAKTEEQNDKEGTKDKSQNLENNSAQGTPLLKVRCEQFEEPFREKELDERQEFEDDLEIAEKSGNTEKAIIVAIAKTCDSEEVVDNFLCTKSDVKPEANAKPIIATAEIVSKEQSDDYMFDDISENRAYTLTALNSPLRSSNIDILLEDHCEQKSNSSLKKDSLNEDESQHDFFQDIEVENPTSFAVMPENQDDICAESLKKTSSLEYIETYSLTGSEEETIIHTLTDSESCNDSEYDTYGDHDDDDDHNKSLELTNQIFISDDSLEAACENMPSKIKSYQKIFNDRELQKQAESVDFKQKSMQGSKKNNSQVDASINASTREIKCFSQDALNCSYSAEEDSDEEIDSTRSSSRYLQDDEEEKSLTLEASSINPKSNENLKNVFPETPEKSLSVSNSDEDKSEIVLNSVEGEIKKTNSFIKGNIDFKASQMPSNQSRGHQKKTEEDKIFNISEEKQNLDHDVTDHLTPTEDYKICMPELRSPITDQETNANRIIFKDVVEPLSEETSDIKISEKTAKARNNLQYDFEILENKYLTYDLYDTEDNESYSSRSYSPTPENRSCTSQDGFGEPAAPIDSKVNPCTKTKAAYKAYDLQHVVDEEYISDSETENPGSNLEKFEVDFNAIAKDCDTIEPIFDTANKNPLLFAPFSSENKSKHLLKETESLKSKSDQTAMLDEESVKSDSGEDDKSLQLKEILNKLTEIKSFEDNSDEIVRDDTRMISKNTKSKSFTPKDLISTSSSTIAIDTENSILFTQPLKLQEEGKRIEASKNDLDININSLESSEATCKANLKFANDSNYDEKAEETSKSSYTSELLDIPVTQINASGQENIEISNISLEAKDQSVITEIPKTENSYSAIENISKNAIEEIGFLQVLQNVQEGIEHSLETSNKKIKEHEIVETKEKLESEIPVLRKEVSEKSTEFSSISSDRQYLEDIIEGKFSKVILEDKKITSIILVPETEVKADDKKMSCLIDIEKSDQVVRESSNKSYRSAQTSESGQISENDNTEDTMEVKVSISKSTKEIEERDLEESSISTLKKDLIFEDSNLTEDVNKQDNNEPVSQSRKEIEPRDFEESSVESKPDLTFEDSNLVEEINAEERIELELEPPQTIDERNVETCSIAKKDMTLEDLNLTEMVNKEDNALIPKSTKEIEVRDLKENPITPIKKDVMLEDPHLIEEMNIEEGNEQILESPEEKGKRDCEENSITTIKKDLISEGSIRTQRVNIKESGESASESSEEIAESDGEESSTVTLKKDLLSEGSNLIKYSNEEEDNEQISASAVEASIATTKKDLISKISNITERLNIEESNSLKEEDKSEENNCEKDLGFTSQLNQFKIKKKKQNNSEEGKNDLTLKTSTIEFKAINLEESSLPINSSRSECELNQLLKRDGLKVSNNDSNVEVKDICVNPDAETLTKQNDLEGSCILANKKLSLFENQNILQDGAIEEDNKEKMTKEEVASITAKLQLKNKVNDFKENLMSNSELAVTSEIKIILKEITKSEDEAGKVHIIVAKTDLKPNTEKDLINSFLPEAQDQNLKVVFPQEDACDRSLKQDCEVPKQTIKEKLKCNNEDLHIGHQNLLVTNNFINKKISSLQSKDEEILDKIEKPRSFEKTDENCPQILSSNEKTVQKSTTEESPKENLMKTASVKTSSKSCLTPDELSVDFCGFKHQSSFEDESGDFHGFEDLEEVARIRQEVENLNEDSAANDGFLNNLSLNRATHKTSMASLTDSLTSEINEMEALEKELSQHQLEMEVTDEDRETDKEYEIKPNKVLSTNDIEHIKQMLESDEEAQNDGENKLEMMAHTSKDKSIESKNINILNDRISSIIPKLSDLCRAALNSSSNSSSNLAQQQNDTSTILVEREQSVEEALAEMYRQAGVLLSDSEDCDNDLPPPADTEGHDVLLINLQEILNSSDNSDVYVLQCDMNENVLNVVQPGEEHQEESLEIETVNTERVNTVQIILDTQNSEPQIHIISSDSESEVIILSDDDSDIGYKQFKAREENITIPFINDEEINNVDDNLFDISTIHHEEIVPDNLNKFLRDEFYKYLHEKYVQRSISKYYHAHRVFKKYKRRFFRRQ